MTPCKLVYSRHLKCTTNLRRGAISHITNIFSNTDVRTSDLSNKLESEVKQRIFSKFFSCVNADPKIPYAYVRVDRPTDGARCISGTGGKMQS